MAKSYFIRNNRGFLKLHDCCDPDYVINDEPKSHKKVCEDKKLKCHKKKWFKGHDPCGCDDVLEPCPEE